MTKWFKALRLYVRPPTPQILQLISKRHETHRLLLHTAGTKLFFPLRKAREMQWIMSKLFNPEVLVSEGYVRHIVLC